MEERDKEKVMFSVAWGTIKQVKTHLNAYKSIQDQSFFDYELLKCALKRKHKTILNLLLELGCRSRNPNKIEETPLHLAMQLNDVTVIKKVLKNGASINDKNCEDETPLQAALKKKMYDSIDVVLQYCSSKNVQQWLKRLNPKDKDDILHFHIACFRNHLEVVKLYLKCGFDVNSPFSLNSEELSGLNPVHYAVTNKYSSLFECLVQHGADFSVKNSEGLTALHIIFYSDFTENGARMIFQAFNHGNLTLYTNCVDSNGVSHLHLCCIADLYSDHVKEYIGNGVDVNSAISLSCPINPGFTPLHFAVTYSCEKVVKLLLKSGADCNKSDKRSATPLHIGCKLFRKAAGKAIIKMLLDYEACVTSVDGKGQTPIHTMFYNLNCEETEIIDMLISKIPREVNFTDNQGLSHFHIVCTRNDISRVEEFLKSGVMVNSSVVSGKYKGYTALHFAALYNQKDVVELLLKWHAQVNVKTSELQLTPLHLACKLSIEKFYELYLKYNDWLKPTTYYSDREDWACNQRNQLDIIKLFFIHKADVDAKDSLGKTPLLQACMIGDNYCDKNWCHVFKHMLINRLKEILEIFLSTEVNLNACVNNQSVLLHTISEDNFLKHSEEYLIEFLISKGAVDVHAVDDAGLTPLHIAVKYCNLELVQIFLKHKANVNAKSKKNETPLQLLLENMSKNFTVTKKDIFLTLLENGCDVNVRSENGRTLLHNAIECRRMFIVKKLLDYDADVNLKDSVVNSSVSSLFKWESEKIDSINQSYAAVFKIVVDHVKKLLDRKLYVSEEVRNCCNKLRQHYNMYASFKRKNLHNDSNKMEPSAKFQKSDRK